MTREDIPLCETCKNPLDDVAMDVFGYSQKWKFDSERGRFVPGPLESLVMSAYCESCCSPLSDQAEEWLASATLQAHE